MSNVTRHNGIEEDPIGAYVYFEDYEKLREELETMRRINAGQERNLLTFTELAHERGTSLAVAEKAFEILLAKHIHCCDECRNGARLEIYAEAAKQVLTQAKEVKNDG